MRTPAALLLATLAASGALAQERYDLDRRTGARPQEVTTRTMLTTGRLMLFGPPASEEQLRDFRRYLSSRAVIVEKCLEVDAGGNPTRVLAHIRDWTDRRGDREAAVTDTSLRGASIAVTGIGRDRSWRFVGEAPAVSDEARQWLDANFGAEPPIGTLVENLLPKRKVAVGESWEAGPAPLLQRIWRYPVAAAAGKGVGGGVDSTLTQLQSLAEGGELPPALR